MHFYYNVFLLLICALLTIISYTSAAISNSPSGHAFDQFRKMRALPTVAQHAQLSIQTSSRIRKQGLIATLQRYCSPDLPDSEQEIQNVIDSVRYMGPDGSTKFFTIELADRNSKVKFVAVAARMDPKGELLDYAIGSYSYQTPSRVHYETAYLIDFLGLRWFQYQKEIVDPNPPIDGVTRVQLEASFMYELSRRDLLRVDDNKDQIELLPIAGPGKSEL